MNLDEYAGKVYSQFGEDLLTLELVRRLNPPHSFLEVGAGDGSENCSRILTDLGWTGIWIDANPEHTNAARVIAEPLGVRVVTMAVTAENCHVVRSYVAQELGMLSIDIDGNDYWVWKALCRQPYGLRPWLVIAEAQIQRPHDEPYVMPYDPLYVWDHKSNDCGASILSMKQLGYELGYTYLGKLSDPSSPNMFFVRSNLADRIE